MGRDTTLTVGSLVCSFCAFQLLFYVVSPRLSAKLSPGFNSLSYKKKIEWDSRVGSTCHALVVGLIGLYAFFFDEDTIADPIWGHSPLVKVNIVIASGYLISDLLVLILYWKVIGDVAFVIHHCVSLFAFASVLKDNVLEYIANVRLLAELSSPFVNQRWFLQVLKYPQTSRANVVNGVLMTGVFFLARVATMPLVYGYLYSVYGTEPYLRMSLVARGFWVVSCVTLDVLNVSWMVKITKGCFKVISLLRQEKGGARLQNGKLD